MTFSYSTLGVEELVRVCSTSAESAAWEEFVRRFHRLIAGVALRTARRWEEPSPQFLDDLIQEIYLKICDDRFRLLREFKSEHAGSIFGFLKILAANVVRDHFKSTHAQKRGSGKGEESLESANTLGREDPSNGPAAIERCILLGEIEDHLNQCVGSEQRDRMVFWLYYRQGLTASAIASMPSVGLTSKGVESAILRMTRLIRSRMAAALENRDANRQDGKGFEIPGSF